MQRSSFSDLCPGADQADADLAASTTNDEAGVPVMLCQLVRRTVVLIPRRPQNLWAGVQSGPGADYHVRRLLPDRYAPARGGPIKDIEFKYYPDLARRRTVTAVVTETGWDPQHEERSQPRVGATANFQLGPRTTANVSLSVNQSTTDADGCASVELTVNTLPADKPAIAAAGTIEVLVNVEADGTLEVDSLILVIHRNEDVDAVLADAEAPADFATSLAPVCNLETWLVRQSAQVVVSNGVKAVQQLINQVLCRKRGNHPFLRPDGRYGAGLTTAVAQFVENFGAAPTGPAIDDYARCRFGVKLEEESAEVGVEHYVRSEYGAYVRGQVVDGHVLEGLGPWAAGGTITGIGGADGLLDIYRAVVWPFITGYTVRAEAYVNCAVRFMRHPDDDIGPSGGGQWPDAVTSGVAYGYSLAASLDEYEAKLNAHNPAPNAITAWSQYHNGSKIGIHQSEYNANTGQSVHYIGIDCSAFVQRVTVETMFAAGHCTDLAGERIARAIPTIEARTNGWWPGKLGTSTWNNNNYRRNLTANAWRKEVVFGSDFLNVPANHIVFLDLASRSNAMNGTSLEIWIYHASGTLAVPAAIPDTVWNPSECTRRTIRSPLRFFATGANGYDGTNNNVTMSRIIFWT
ncbi:hypothetical protein [Nannocystis pusilla]|uniref:hypothetical protein n=1 Tax=Nannocystis pusilla TaxID=889268 RepID=UPI003DA59BB3